MTEVDMSKVLRELSEKASTLGLDLKGYEPHIVQRDSNGMNVIYVPPNSQKEKEFVIISCKEDSSGLQIIGHNSGSTYCMNKICRKLGVELPARSDLS